MAIHYPQTIGGYSGAGYTLTSTPQASCIQWDNANGCLYHDTGNAMTVSQPSYAGACEAAGGSNTSTWRAIIYLDLGQVITADLDFSLLARINPDSPKKAADIYNPSYFLYKAANDTPTVPVSWSALNGDNPYIADDWGWVTQRYTASGFKDTRWVKIEFTIWDWYKEFWFDMAGLKVESSSASPTPLPMPSASAKFYFALSGQALAEKFSLPFSGVNPGGLTLDKERGTVVIGSDGPANTPVIYSPYPYATGTAGGTNYPTGTSTQALEWI